MPFTSPFGNIAELNFNPSSAQLPQNQKPLAQPSQSQSPKPMAMPEPASPEAFSTPNFSAMVRPLLAAAPQTETPTPMYTPKPMVQALPAAMPQPMQLPQLTQPIQNPNKLIFV